MFLAITWITVVHHLLSYVQSLNPLSRAIFMLKFSTMYPETKEQKELTTAYFLSKNDCFVITVLPPIPNNNQDRMNSILYEFSPKSLNTNSNPAEISL